MDERRLGDADEGIHPVGPELNWNESRYIDFRDPESGIGGWFRIGMRPNEGRAEMSACVYLPDGRAGFFFERAPIDGNGLTAGGQRWSIGDPYRENTVRYRGPMLLLDDPWAMTDPKRAYQDSPRVDAEIDLTVHSTGLSTVMGREQWHIDRIFLPGQADWHYQHLCRSVGTVRLGDQTWRVDGRGGKDHSWGPRNWHAKIYLRWLICAVDDDTGFMLVRAVGPTKKTRGGFVLDGGEFHVVDDFTFRSRYGPGPRHVLESVSVTATVGARSWSATGTPQGWLPVRHRQPGPDGREALLRIVKSPTVWTWSDGRAGSGHNEWHDLVVDGIPIGLDD
ncbi:conserved hypothetical protein [Frankia canadensis]|uniref:Hydroxyneurosporene synthase (CrtC) n=1 Tax=Frankia canadensis TaxID=1836972 RepID=A0A2I2KUD9_9ACTN|nr:hypothetical protein [Frankia canadensis]SNQ49272.1 conserved hypothetical protein [Frankia canadensis]SOU56562.1 conserved hypothetical protein [Frankia canadensis]